MILTSYRVFSAQTAYLKAPYFYASLGVPKSLGLMIDPKKHRIHRNVLSPLFSKPALARLSEILEIKVEQVVDVIGKHFAEGKAVDIQNLYRRLTVGVTLLYFRYSTLGDREGSLANDFYFTS